MVRSILFVCTGNTCRSPLAEGLFREMIKREGLAITVKSAGVSAMSGASISSHSQTVLREKGAGDGYGSSRMLDRQLAEEAELILTMTASHKRRVLSRFPETAGRVYTLKEYAEEPQVRQQRELADRDVAELIAKQAVSGEMTAEERHKALLYTLSSDQDISDPFGGPIAEYRQVGNEIESCLLKLITRLKSE